MNPLQKFLPVAFILWAGLVCALASERVINGKHCELKNGALYVDGQWRFMKTGKPLRNFADAAQVDQLIADLALLKAKGYTNLELNCYWHHFDTAGDGSIAHSLEPLRRLIDAIQTQGMFASLSVETYAVGGGALPEAFWKKHPEAVAVDSEGRAVRDTEYGFNSIVPSLFDENYLAASRRFIANLAAGLADKDFLYCETTVEPQYMGTRQLDYGPSARAAYEKWRARNPGAPMFPRSFPVDKNFIKNPYWNRFRAEHLAAWVSGDIAAFRQNLGDKHTWMAVDYLDADEGTMAARVGDPMLFLEGLKDADIIQVNWHWHIVTRSPNDKAYRRVRAAMKTLKKDWAISEHMTLNGSDFKPAEVRALLKNTLAQGTQFGWEFADLSCGGDFSLYKGGWKPKPVMAVIEDNWDYWKKQIQSARERAK